jgi:hypothetical protein
MWWLQAEAAGWWLGNRCLWAFRDAMPCSAAAQACNMLLCPQASVTCAATGPLSVPDVSRIRGAEGHEVFSERKGLNLFKNKVAPGTLDPALQSKVLDDEREPGHACGAASSMMTLAAFQQPHHMRGASVSPYLTFHELE